MQINAGRRRGRKIGACRAASARTTRIVWMSPSLPALPRGLIAVIDDDAGLRHALAFMFQAEGFRVASFADPLAFLAAPAGEMPDCLVVDQMMPGMTGLELVARLRQDGATLPVVLITGRSDRRLACQARAAGVTTVIEKPLLGTALLDAVTACLQPAAR
jgi:two-component system response regulator FixJ